MDEEMKLSNTSNEKKPKKKNTNFKLPEKCQTQILYEFDKRKWGELVVRVIIVIGL